MEAVSIEGIWVIIIPALSIEQFGPGIELEAHAAGVAITMSDPVSDLAYARNAVTLTYDLSGAVTARLQFEAMEFGDEPHRPKERNSLLPYQPEVTGRSWNGDIVKSCV